MKVLFIGGSGNISTWCSRLALEQDIDLYHLNRGQRVAEGLDTVKLLRADINDQPAVERLLGGLHFDVVVNFIAFTREEVERDIRLFEGKCGQYIFISSASAYQKPPSSPWITESTPLANPWWDYSRNKIACEDLLTAVYRERGFPMTIVRPSHTYDMVIPAAVGSWEDFTLIRRMREGRPVVIHGDGTSLWVLTHSLDFAKAFNGLLANEQAIGHAFHITSDEVLSWNQIYAIMAEAAGVKLSAVHATSGLISSVAEELGIAGMRGNLLGDKSHSLIFDNSKIKRFVPGFTATVPFREGIRRTIDWYDRSGACDKIDPDNERLMGTIVDRLS